ncbi:MAG: hypothetical protein ACI9HK_004047 [Pirellulaceae bacterium]
MTAQRPERFINEHPRIDAKGLRLYFVSADLPAKPAPPEDELRSTDLWRGYVATWLLNEDGTLEVLQFEFPYFERAAPHFQREPVVQKVESGLMSGNFTLTFRPFFFGPNTEVPFVNGRVVEDRGEWRIEDQTFEAEVVKPLKQSGLIVRTIGGLGFIPKSLLPQGSNLASMVGERLKCEIFDCDDERGTLILRPT